MTSWPFGLNDAICGAGLALVTIGLVPVFWPAALIVIGAAGLAVGVLRARHRAETPADDT